METDPAARFLLRPVPAPPPKTARCNLPSKSDDALVSAIRFALGVIRLPAYSSVDCLVCCARRESSCRWFRFVQRLVDLDEPID